MLGKPIDSIGFVAQFDPELAAMMDPPITKPAMNHRLKKLMEMAKEAYK